ncbi:MAG TPA: hypothetical protein VNT20_22485 [Flavisolibacter sp.]|jgi:hypothetical protein|nr:hypothetical protein [Flavisolibacter sp.]
MKMFLILFCSFTLVAGIAAFAYNSDKGPAKQKDGISELPEPTDSVLNRGKELVSKMNYSDQDLRAVAAYLNKK